MEIKLLGSWKMFKHVNNRRSHVAATFFKRYFIIAFIVCCDPSKTAERAAIA